MQLQWQLSTPDSYGVNNTVSMNVNSDFNFELQTGVYKNA
jgi:hypothetical protein